MNRDALGLGQRLGMRLRPLALATGLLISLGLPATYYVLELRSLGWEAELHARDLAERLPARHPTDPRWRLHPLLGDFLGGRAITAIRVLDRDGRELDSYRPAGSWWWDLRPPVGRVALGRQPDALQLEVAISQTGLLGITAALLLLSTAVGMAIAGVMYFYPVRVVRGAEAQVEDVLARQEGLLEASGLLASTLDLREVLDRLTEIARSLPGIDVVRIWLRDERGDLVCHSQAGVQRGDVPQELTLPAGQGLTAAVVDGGRPVAVQDTLADPRLVNSAWFRAEGLASYLGVPLKVGDDSVGALACMSRASREWTRTEIALAETLGSLAAVAIRNARLFGESETRRRAAEALAEVGRIVAQALEAKVVGQRIADSICALLRTTNSAVFRLDPQSGDLFAVGLSGSAGPALGLGRRFPRGQGVAALAVAAGHPVTTADVLDDARVALTPELRASIEEAGYRAVLVVPLVVQDRVIGALSAGDRRGRLFTPEEIRIARAFGDQAALALENARLYQDSAARQRRLTTMVEVARKLTSRLDYLTVLDTVADAAVELFGAEVGFRLIEGDDLVLRRATPGARQVMVNERIKVGESISGRVAATGEPIVTTDIPGDPRVIPAHRVSAERTTSLMCVPIRGGSRILGTLNIYRERGRRFDDDALDLALSLANQAGVALENARLYSEATRRRHEAEELARVARSLTETLDVSQVGRRIVESVLPLFAVQSSGLFLLQPDRSLQAVAWGGGSAAAFPADQVFPPGIAAIGRVVTSGGPVRSRDILADADIVFTDDLREKFRAAGNRAVLSVPLRAKGELVGVLSIADSTARDFTDAELGLLQAFGDQAALALENARLYENAQRAYQELSQTQAQLVRGETLRAMGELASGVAHHLNNLLAVVLGRLQLARARQPSAPLDRHLELAERAALDGAEVVRRMRGFSRGQPSPDLTPVDLNRVADEVIELTRPRWQDEAQVRGVQIETRLEAGDVPEVAGEVAALREVLMNLVLNSIDALPAGGTITVRTWAADGAVHCQVADDGMGMTQEVQRRALEPFFTTKGFQSTGLGLSVNYGIIRRHGGELVIDSAPGEGARVTFQLPIARPVPLPVREELPPVTSPLRILVVDDEQEVRDVVAEILAAQGHEVIQAAGGVEGLAWLDREATFDLVLTDLGMPGMTGWEVARAAKARRPSVRVGLLTGWGEQPIAKPEERAAADFVLAKPVTVDGLRAALATVRSARAS